MAAMVLRREEVNNKILASLPPEEFAELEPLLQPVGLESGDRLYDLDEVLSHVHFVDGGLLSLLSTLEDGTSSGQIVSARRAVSAKTTPAPARTCRSVPTAGDAASVRKLS